MGMMTNFKVFFHKKNSESNISDNKYKQHLHRSSACDSLSDSSSNSSTKSMDVGLTSVLASKQINSEAGGYNYQYKDGRRYHAQKDVAYLLPNDDDEVDRVHQQHWILRHAFQCNFHAPVEEMLKEGINVLDSGCGPATWTFEIGENYPRSKIYGADASCVFPENVKPANVEFAIGNIAKRIPHEDGMFHYIHQRLLFVGLTQDDWTNSLQEHFRVLKPGGYIELIEPGFKQLFAAGPCLNLLMETLRKSTASRGIQFEIGEELEDRVQKAGFENVHVKKLEIPLNHNGKIGELFWDDYRHAFMNLKGKMTQASPEFEAEGAYEAHLNECAREARRSKANSEWYVVYAQKPLSGTP
ncbi:S-adenosyl-L-methionine-dependent methyltransferase [Blakeslea trispora]|nr:S-adenosyl-L-methionine-dependent methyltransferase [Blakeslea trispora]